MDGFILVDKKVGVSSYKAIKIVKKHFNTNKVGHCGTLDPFASGLLIIAINQATKALSFLENDYKEYLATIKLGVKTDTLDLDGKIIATSNINKINKEELEKILLSFEGDISQIPPIYSAISVKGKRLYEYARNNEEVTIPSRIVHIYKINLLNLNDDSFTIDVKCSKGTYIRTLGEDIALKTNNLAHVCALRRISIGKFNVKEAISYDDLEKGNLKVYNIKDCLNLKTIETKDESILKRVYHGQKIILKKEDENILLICDDTLPIAIYQKDENHVYKCLRGLFNEDSRLQRLKEF